MVSKRSNEREGRASIMEATRVLVPGILVALRTSVNGGVEYRREDLEEDAEGRVKRWKTTRLTEDPAEHEAALELAKKAGWRVARLCVRTSFGLLCRNDREPDLDAAVVEIRRLASEFNATAKHSFVRVTAIKGRIANNDAEAVRAILDEARDLLDRMERGLSEGDVTLIRDAANRAKRLSGIMTESSSAQVSAAVQAARQAARAIVKRGDDLANQVAGAVVKAETEAFAAARFAFLDEAATVTEALPAVDLQRTADLEIAEEVA